jgi:hypothetical protein
MTAGTTEPPSDFRDCPYPIAYDLQVQDSEWIVEAKNANEGFDCLTIYQGSETQEKKELIPEEFAIEEICYLTLAEVQRAARAAEQCGQKPYPPDSIPPLQPGSYYRLEVETQLEVDIPPENLPPLPSPLDDALFNLYKDLVITHK